MWWQVGLVANAVIALAYLAISWAILKPLMESGQLASNRLGAATAAIFLTCAVHHGSHTVHLLLPYLGVEQRVGEALRVAIDWHSALWDVVTAVVGIYYWSLRRTYGELMKGAKLFEDLKERQRQALEINDNIVQGLAVAEMALRLNETEMSQEAIGATLQRARAIITDLLGDSGSAVELGPGDLRRSAPAELPRLSRSASSGASSPSGATTSGAEPQP